VLEQRGEPVDGRLLQPLLPFPKRIE
jgi:hypothetical protein